MAGSSRVPFLHGGLLNDQPVAQIQHGQAKHAGTVRIAAGLSEGRRVAGDDHPLQAVGHVAPAGLVEVLADRRAAVQHPRVAWRSVPVDDGHFGVRSVEGAQRCGVALLNAAAQCLRVECGGCGIHRVLLSLSCSIALRFPRHRQSTVKARKGQLPGDSWLAARGRRGGYLSMAVLEVRLLGELGVELDGSAVTLPTSRRACLLLGWLALRSGPHSRSRLAALLWPDVLDASARASLRSALWALRAAFGPAAAEYLHTGRDHVELAGDGLLVDARELDRLLAAGCPREAVALHRGDLLSQFDADWVLDARDEHRDGLCAAYTALAAAAEADGQVATARDWAAKRAAARPLDEQAARDLIRLLVAAGEQAGAVAASQRHAARLGAELG